MLFAKCCCDCCDSAENTSGKSEYIQENWRRWHGCYVVKLPWKRRPQALLHCTHQTINKEELNATTRRPYTCTRQSHRIIDRHSVYFILLDIVTTYMVTMGGAMGHRFHGSSDPSTPPLHTNTKQQRYTNYTKAMHIHAAKSPNYLNRILLWSRAMPCHRSRTL